jgi:hypothetical protein
MTGTEKLINARSTPKRTMRIQVLSRTAEAR